MILRRIAHHLQQQQWTAVLIELAIVILGVFLGFQVTDWASERAGRSADVIRPTSVVSPNGLIIDMPAGPPVADADRTTLLARANLTRSSTGNRTGFEALLGAGGMQKTRDRRISRQLQVYYAGFDDLVATATLVKQLRADGVAIGHTLGLSAFGEMDPDKLIAVVRGSPAYSAYLRSSREWSAILLSSADEERLQALELLANIEAYLGKGGRRP